MYRVLICDDEEDIRSGIRLLLSSEGMIALEAENGEQALQMLRQGEEINLVLLDIMLPTIDGLHVLEELRRQSNVPVILLSAKSEDEDVILGLNIGADDYIAKPFKPSELIARVQAQLRRYMRLGSGSNSRLIRIGGLELNDNEKSVLRDGTPVFLTPLEYDILCLLMKNAGRVFSPKDIYRIVWNAAPMGAENAVAVHIRHIREKIEQNPAEPKYLKVIWGKGYKIQPVREDGNREVEHGA